MRCQAIASKRIYSPAGPCQKRFGVRLVRWAPQPLTTMVAKLCTHHRGVLERGGTVKVAK